MFHYYYHNFFQLQTYEVSSEIGKKNKVEEKNCTEVPEYAPLEENITEKESKDSDEEANVSYLLQL